MVIVLTVKDIVGAIVISLLVICAVIFVCLIKHEEKKDKRCRK